MKLPMPKFKNHKYTALAYFLPCFIFLLIQIAIGVLPFGKQSMLYSDCWHQYYPFFKTFREMLLSGEGLLYNWHVGMGFDNLGLYAYYLASPLNWLCVLIPESWTLAFFDLLYPIKLGFAGLFFAIFLKKLFHKDDLSISIFGTLYALCSWALCYQWNIMWVDTFALLPLLMLGMVSLLKEKKFLLYTVTLFLSLVSNYYIGYMSCVFVLLSFFCYQICNFTTPKRFVDDFLRIGVFTVIAIGMTAVLTLPTLAALQTTHASSEKFPEGFQLNLADENTWKGLLDAMRQVFGSLGAGNITDQSFKDSRLPNIYCGVGTLLLSFLFLSSRHIKLREKLCCTALALLILLSFVIKQLDYMWHGFHFANMIYNRFSFLLCFVLIFMAYRAWMMRRYFKPSQIAAAGIFTTGILLCSEKPAGFDLWNLSFDWLKLDRFDWKNLPNWQPDFNDPEALTLVYVVLNVLLMAFFLGVLFYGAAHKPVKWKATEKQLRAIVTERRNRRAAADAAFASIIVLEMLLSTVNFAGSFSFTGVSNYPLHTEHVSSAVRYMYEREDELFFRAETSHTSSLNDGALNGYMGISTFASSANVNVTKFMQTLGSPTSASWNRYVYEDTSPVTNLFLGLKYMIDRTSQTDINTQEKFSYVGRENPYWNQLYNRGSVYLLENTHYLPLGFLANTELGDLEFRTSADYFPFQNDLFTAATGIQEPVFTFTPDEWLQIIPSNVTITSSRPDGYCDYTGSSSSGTLTYQYTANDTGLLCIDATMNSNSFTVKKNGQKLFTETAGRWDVSQAFSLCQVAPGDVVEVVATIKANEDRHFTIKAALMDDAIFQQGYDILKASTLELTEFKSTHVTGTVNCNRNGLLYTSVPQTGSNWVAYVDGKQADITLVGNCMIGIELTKGQHTVELRYQNKAFATGMTVSVICTLALAVITVWFYKPEWVAAVCKKLNIQLPEKPAKKHKANGKRNSGKKRKKK